MAYVDVPKDLTNIKTKFIGNFTNSAGTPLIILQSPFIYAMIVPIFQRKRCHICQRKHTCPFHGENG